MRVRLKGINTVKRKHVDGSEVIHYYHRASGKPLSGRPGTAAFVASIAAAEASMTRGGDNTLSGLIRAFEKTAKWRKLADSTKAEYRRVFKFWDGKFGPVPLAGLAQKSFRKRVLEWHDAFSADKPREADNRVTILARVLAWGAADGDLADNVLAHFDRSYESDRADKIWLPEHVDAFMSAADPEMQLALVLAMNTGQRQADIRKLAWSQYDGAAISVTQGKTGARVRIPCTVALKATLDVAPKRGTLILLTKTSRAFQKRYFAERWDAAYRAAGLPLVPDQKRPGNDQPELHFHDIRGTTVTMLFEAGCNVAEVASITGHTLRRAQEILDKYLSRTGGMAKNAIAKFEAAEAGRNISGTNSANGMQTEPLSEQTATKIT